MSGLTLQAPEQEHRNVAGTLADGNYLYGITLSAIDDEVGVNRPEQHRLAGKVFTYVAHAGRSTQRFERTEESCYPAVSSVNVVLRNVFPDSIKIKFGIRSKDVGAQALDFRRAADLPCSLALASAGTTRWPRSSESSRRPSSWLNAAN